MRGRALNDRARAFAACIAPDRDRRLGGAVADNRGTAGPCVVPASSRPRLPRMATSALPRERTILVKGGVRRVTSRTCHRRGARARCIHATEEGVTCLSQLRVNFATGMPSRGPRLRECASVAPFSVRAVASWHGALQRRLPRLQGLARRRSRDPRAAACRRPRRGGGRRRRRCRRDQHLLRHERGRREEPQGRCTRGAHARARLRHGLRGEPRAERLREPARQRGRRRAPRRGDGRVRRRRRRRDRLRPGRRAARPRPRVREDPGRLLVLLRLLRDPARARRARAAARADAVLDRGRAAASSRATARSC